MKGESERREGEEQTVGQKEKGMKKQGNEEKEERVAKKDEDGHRCKVQHKI